MSRASGAESLLALFATRDLATSIVGDLTEESRGSVWFWTQTFRTALALCFKSIVAAPVRSLWLAVVGLLIYGGIYTALMTVSGLWWYPWHRVGEIDFWIRVVLVATVTNFATGTVIGRWVSSAQTSGLAPLTAVWLVAWALWPLRLFAFTPWAFGALLVFTFLCLFPVLGLAPLLVGGALGQRLKSQTLVPHSSGTGASSPHR